MAAAVAAAVRRRDENRRDGDDGDPVVRTATKTTVVAEDLLPPKTESGFWKYQREAARVYLGIRVQLTVAGLIGGNFLMNIIEKWIDPEGDQHPGVWLGFDIFFNVSFTIELMWNMYSFWLCRFWKSAWNCFDVVVVSIGLMNYVLPDLPGPLGLLRMMRAFRVFRLFKRVESLRKIMQSLGKAVPGVANAFFIQTLTITEESFEEPNEDVVMKKKTKKKKQRFDPANEIGVCAPLGFFDPLGFAPKNKRNNFKNLRAMEIKHGRIAMLATVGSVVQHFIHRPDLPEPWQTYVGPVNPVGIGALAIFYGPVGFIQLLGGLFGIFIFEFFLWLERDDRDPGDYGNPLSIPLDTPEMRLKELNNGRMAMISIAGIWAAELVTKKDAVEQLMFWA